MSIANQSMVIVNSPGSRGDRQKAIVISSDQRPENQRCYAVGFHDGSCGRFVESELELEFQSALPPINVNVPMPAAKPPLVLKDLDALKSQQRSEPWGALLVRYGFDPYETESSARRVAEKSAEDISTLSQALHNVLVHMSALGIPCDEDSLVRARTAIEKVNRKSGGAGQ